jgi:trigger factor
MQVTETLAEGLKREFKVTVPASELEQKLDGRLAEIGQSVRIPGFRPGKVPATLLKQRYGDTVRGEILQQAITDSWQRAVNDKGLRPAVQPKIEIVTFEPGADLEYKMAFELIPEIALPDLSKIELERLVPEIGEDEVERAIQRLAENRKTFAATEEGRAAASGDRLRVDFTGRVDGNEFPGGTGKDVPIVLGSGMFIPGFAEQLEGASPGEKREVKVAFPADYGVKDLAGKDAVFDVEVKAVESPSEVAIDEAFAQALGVESLEKLRAGVREQIEREYATVTRALLKRKMLDALADAAQFELPAAMVDQEFEAIWQRVKEAMEQGKLDPDDVSKTEDELRAQYRAIAERRVKLGLLLAEIGRANNIQVAQEDLNRAMTEHARRYPGQERRVLEFFRENPEATHELHAPIFEDKVADFITAMAHVMDRKVPVAELLAAAQDGGGDAGEATA